MLQEGVDNDSPADFDKLPRRVRKILQGLIDEVSSFFDKNVLFMSKLHLCAFVSANIGSLKWG